MSQEFEGKSADLGSHVSTIKIASQLVEATPLATCSGYSWTLASQLGEMLQIAESRFGPRDTSYTVLGFEFAAGQPQIWFPSDRGQIVVQLGNECLLEPDRACFQLAHETIHLLDPLEDKTATYLEEGLATHFQLRYMAECYPPDWPRLIIDWEEQLGSYASARSLVEQLLEEDPDAIRRLRNTPLRLSQITAQQIQDTCSTLPSRVAHALALNFYD